MKKDDKTTSPFRQPKMSHIIHGFPPFKVFLLGYGLATRCQTIDKVSVAFIQAEAIHQTLGDVGLQASLQSESSNRATGEKQVHTSVRDIIGTDWTEGFPHMTLTRLLVPKVGTVQFKLSNHS